MRAYVLGVVETQVYEVRCPRCQTSFAPETRRCVHCGGPVQAGQPVASMGGGRPPVEPASGPLPEEPDDATDELSLGGRGRGALWLLTAILAVAGSLVRTCQGG